MLKLPEGETLGIMAVQTAAGWVGLAFSAQGLVELRFPVPSRAEALGDLQAAFPAAALLPEDAWASVQEQLRRYFAGERVEFDAPLDLRGWTPFQRRVWEAARRIPYGETRTYSGLAQEIGAPKAYRAVGSALAANPVPIIIPCHRVLRNDGALGGFGGGLPLKQRLLDMERK